MPFDHHGKFFIPYSHIIILWAPILDHMLLLGNLATEGCSWKYLYPRLARNESNSCRDESFPSRAGNGTLDSDFQKILQQKSTKPCRIKHHLIQDQIRSTRNLVWLIEHAKSWSNTYQNLLIFNIRSIQHKLSKIKC